MAKQVVGLFSSMADARSAVSDLQNSGFTSDSISLVARNTDDTNTTTDGDGGTRASEDAAFGAVSGTLVGGAAGVLAGLGLLAIPGIGPVLAAGSLATALGLGAAGAGIGAASGGLIGALVGAGIPDEDANIYAEGVRRGGALLTVQTDSDDLAQTAADIMDRHNVQDIDNLGSDYRSGGWSRFDETGTSDSSDGGSGIGTGLGTLSGAATGAAIGSVGGPIGTVIGGVAGALTGAGVGAVGDRLGAAAADDDTGSTSSNTDYRSTNDTSYRSGSMGGDSASQDYAESSKIGTVGGGTAGALTGAAMGSVAGPIGTVVGGVAGALVGGTGGAVGDTLGEKAEDAVTGGDMSGSTSRTSMGSTDTTRTSGMSTDTTNYTASTREGEMAIPVVEEQISIAKREVDRGGVRVETNVVETPVSEQVTLHEEEIHIERRPVNQPISSADISSLQSGSFEVRETDEEAVISKEAHVVEEIVINKESSDRTETIQDTVHRTDVNVEEIPGTTRTSGYTTTSTSSSSDMSGSQGEGMIESAASRLGNAAERGTGLDLDRDGDTGRRDPSNNI